MDEIPKTPMDITRAGIREILARHELTMAEITTAKRGTLRVVRARREIARYLKDERHYTLPQIGRVLSRHYASIIHGMKQEAGQGLCGQNVITD